MTPVLQTAVGLAIPVCGYAAGGMVRYIRPAGVWICTPGSLRT